MGYFEESEQAARAVVTRVGPGVVRIGRGVGRGAGFVVAEGAVLTNAHNLRGAETTVTFSDARSEIGTVAGMHPRMDLAVVRIDTRSAPPLEWAPSSPNLGSPVFVVTYPSHSTIRVTSGTISALGPAFRGPSGRLVSGAIEHTAPLARGSSGSPLVDATGALVGINTHRLEDGFYLAVPTSADLRSSVDALIRGETPRQLYLGVALVPVSSARRLRSAVGLPERDGLLIRAVDTNGPAARAGITAGDLIFEAGGSAVASADQLFEILDRSSHDQSLALRVVRGTSELEVRVTFAGTESGGSA